jgi:hypothetical protein
VLTAEHVPPQSFGGRELLLTCKKCNNEAGTLLDAHARHKEDLAEVMIRPPSKPLKVRVEHRGRKLNARLVASETGWELKVVQRANDPKAVTAFQASGPPKAGEPMNVDFVGNRFAELGAKMSWFEPEDGNFVLRRWADFDFLIVALTRLRQAARLAAKVPQLQASLDTALVQFDEALPNLKKMRDVAEHIDDYALDEGRQKAVARQSLEVSTMEADGPTLCWLQARLNARDASQASRALFTAVKEASQLFRAGSPT